MLNIIIGVFVLGVLVFIHELGHFFAAKLCKIPVLTFSIGFGPKIFSKKAGETQYQIAAIPFGGFVAMEGENPKEGEQVSPNAFIYHPISHRALVAFAGPAFNIISAYVFLVIMYMNGVPHAPYLDTNSVGFVSSESSAFGKIQRDDKIISINGKNVSDWTDIYTKFNDMSSEYSVVYTRGQETMSAIISVPLPNAKTLESKGSGIFPPVPAVIGRVEENSVAAHAGFVQGDSVISINGKAVSSWYAVSDAVANYNDTLPELSVEIMRKGELIRLYVQPEFSREHNRYLIGIVMANPSSEIRKFAFIPSFKLAYDDCIKYSVMIFETMKKLLTRLVSPEYLSGPVGIMQMSGIAVHNGLSAFLQLLALIGINLGILNLMPLVITDGGILSLLLVEAIIRKPIPIAVREKLSYVFMAAFLCLAVLVTFNDILRFSAVENLLK